MMNNLLRIAIFIVALVLFWWFIRMLFWVTVFIGVAYLIQQFMKRE